MQVKNLLKNKKITVFISLICIAALLYIVIDNKKCNYRDIGISLTTDKDDYVIGDTIGLKISVKPKRKCMLQFYRNEIYKHILLGREGKNGEVFFKKVSAKPERINLNKEISIDITGKIASENQNIVVISEKFEKPWMLQEGTNKIYCIFRVREGDWDTDDIMPSDETKINLSF